MLSKHFPTNETMIHFDKLQTLGEGQFGVVFLAVDKRTNQSVALKKIRLGQDRAKEGVHFTALREIKVWSINLYVFVCLETFEYVFNLQIALQFSSLQSCDIR